jgi:hypothetical protein
MIRSRNLKKFNFFCFKSRNLERSGSKLKTMASASGGREIDLTKLGIEQLTNLKTQHEQVDTLDWPSLLILMNRKCILKIFHPDLSARRKGGGKRGCLLYLNDSMLVSVRRNFPNYHRVSRLSKKWSHDTSRPKLDFLCLGKTMVSAVFHRAGSFF